MNQESPHLDQQIRVMQIIAAALVMGVVFFAGIVVVIGALNQPPAGMFMGVLGAGMAAMMMVLHFVVPAVMTRQAADGVSSNAEVTVWAGIYQTKLIIGLALLEGAAFFNLIVCIIEHNWWSLAIAGALVSWMIFAFPTRSRVEQWIENQRIIADQRERL